LSDSAFIIDAGKFTKPGVPGGTNFQNPAFDPQRNIVFIPATEGISVYTKSGRAVRSDDGMFTGSAGADLAPPVPVVRALDAATGAKKWERYSPPLEGRFYYSGLLATRGGLVFGGSAGTLFALDSATGHQLWSVYVGGDTRAAPISFTIDGHQVIAVMAGRSLFVFGL